MRLQLDEQYAASQQTILTHAHELVKVEVVDVKVEPDVTDAVAMSPLSLPISAHNASAALAWLGERADDGIELLLEQAAAPCAIASEYKDVRWTDATDGASVLYAV